MVKMSVRRSAGEHLGKADRGEAAEGKMLQAALCLLGLAGAPPAIESPPLLEVHPEPQSLRCLLLLSGCLLCKLQSNREALRGLAGYTPDNHL